MVVEVTRATYESVAKNQAEFFGVVDQLRTKEELLDKESRPDWLKLVSDAFIGVLAKHNFVLRYDNSIYPVGLLSEFLRDFLPYLNETDIIDGKNIKMILKGNARPVPLKILWAEVRRNCSKPADEALNLAVRASAELVQKETGIFGFSPEQKL
jgi:hypothetical protein